MDNKKPLDPTKPPPGTPRAPLVKLPFDPMKALPFMVAGIVVVMIVQGIIWYSEGKNAKPPSTSSDSMLEATEKVPLTPVVSKTSKTYGNGVITVEFGDDWTVQSGNAPPNLLFSTLTYTKPEFDEAVVRVYQSLPQSFTPPSKEEFRDENSPFWQQGTVNGVDYQLPKQTKIAGRQAMMQEYDNADSTQRAYYVLLDTQYKHYMMIVASVGKLSAHKTDLFGAVDALFKTAKPDPAGHFFADPAGKYEYRLSRFATFVQTADTVKFPLNAVTMKFAKTDATTTQAYISALDPCYASQTGTDFILNKQKAVIFENSTCSPLGESELFIVRNGIAYLFTVGDVPNAKRDVLSGFTFLD